MTNDPRTSNPLSKVRVYNNPAHIFIRPLPHHTPCRTFPLPKVEQDAIDVLPDPLPTPPKEKP